MTTISRSSTGDAANSATPRPLTLVAAPSAIGTRTTCSPSSLRMT